MRRTISAVVATLALAASVAGTALAHDAGPCPGTARDYTAHHVVALAKDGMLGARGHKPAAHMGYSLCLGVHD